MIVSTEQGGEALNHNKEIGPIIKKVIKFRNKTSKIVANELGINEKTFSDQLKNGTMSVDTLFRIAAYLDIDLNWLMAVLGYFGPVSPYARDTIQRMQSEFRKREKALVIKNLDRLIVENLAETHIVRRELLREYGHNEFYLLDVLVPESYEIFVVKDRGKTNFYVDNNEMVRYGFSSSQRRKPISMLFDVKTALDIVIEERKDEINYENNIL